MVALASLALQSAKKLFQKSDLLNKLVTFTLPGADIRAQSIGIDSYTYWGLYQFFPQTMKLWHRRSSEQDMFSWDSSNMRFSLGLA